MVSALDSGPSGPDSSPGRGDCVVFLGKIPMFEHWLSSRYKLITLTVPLSTQEYTNGYW